VKIDAFCHITPARYYERIDSLGDTPEAANIRKRVAGIPVLRDLDERMRVMEEFGDDYVQILSLPAPAIEQFGDASLGRELARVGNEGMAELCRAHPDRFVGFAASLPMNDVDVALEELDHAVGMLGALGVQIYGHVNGRPLDDPRFEPFFERMAALDRPIWVHPARNVDWPDYPTESKSRYEIWWMLGWPYETGVFMARIVFSGILERYPNLKMLTHHAGGVVPHFVGRIGPGMRSMGARTPEHERELVQHSLSRPPIEYFKMFYADTALFGAPDALECAIAFFGVDRVLFASDMPFDPEKGPSFIRASIADLEAADLSDDERQAIYEGNARRVLGVGAAATA
jgi:uncharacterized protein